MSNWTGVATWAGLFAVFASAGGIVAAIFAMRVNRAPAKLEMELNQQRIRLEGIDLSAITRSLEQIQKASAAAAQVRDIDFSRLAQELRALLQASESAATLARHIDVPAILRNLEQISEGSDSAATLSGIDVPNLGEQLEKVRLASDAATLLNRIDVSSLAAQLERLRQASEPAARLAESIDKSGLMEQIKHMPQD